MPLISQSGSENPMPKFRLNENDKLAILAIENVDTDLTRDCEEQLSDGTWVLGRIPVDVEELWKEWLGSIRLDRIHSSNVVLVRTTPSTNPQILDDENEALNKYLTQLFYLLQLPGVIEYEAADLLNGAFLRGQTQFRKASELPHFKQTKGYTRKEVTLGRLEEASRRRASLEQVQAAGPDFFRLIRGLNVLMDGLKQEFSQERLHQFVRSLEALILPETGKTKSQFAHRCQTFTKASAAAKTVLEEAFDLRSEAEHLNLGLESLQSHPAADRENIAFQRTRQMEALACFAYSRILDEQTVRDHFKNESIQENFWKKIDDAARLKIWGSQLDISKIPLAQEYDGWGRTQP